MVQKTQLQKTAGRAKCGLPKLGLLALGFAGFARRCAAGKSHGPTGGCSPAKNEGERAGAKDNGNFTGSRHLLAAAAAGILLFQYIKQ